MAGFTRLCATPGGKPDGLEAEMDTIFTTELPAEVLASHFHFGVLNRPNSFKQLFEVPGMLEKVTSPFVMILETDHVTPHPTPHIPTSAGDVAVRDDPGDRPRAPRAIVARNYGAIPAQFF